jgi:hypothetical protein
MARELKPFVFQPTKAAKSCTQDTMEAERLITANAAGLKFKGDQYGMSEQGCLSSP